MAFTVVPDKAAGDVLTEANWDTHIKDNMNSGVAVVLANTTLAAPAASIDFTSISQSWAHLMLVCYLRGSAAATLVSTSIRLNADSGANYDYQFLLGRAAAASASEAFGATAALVSNIPGASAGANLFSATVIDIPHYSQNTNNKSLTSRNGFKYGTASGNLDALAFADFWRSNSAITQITILGSSGNIDTGSRATLYGLP